MSTPTSVLLLITLWASMEEGLTLPLMKPPQVEVSDGVPTQRLRDKRCACSSRLDSECHYFCHLDIIWVNTPSKTTVYGLGGALDRRRRSAGRCACADLGDHDCANFCRRSPDVTNPNRRGKRSPLYILGTRRAAAGKFKRAHASPDSDRDESSQRTSAR